jgi:hypothetical protein
MRDWIVSSRDYLEAAGPIVARALQETLIQKEEFCLQVDSHSKFVQNWDEKMISMWQLVDNENAVLTGGN